MKITITKEDGFFYPFIVRMDGVVFAVCKTNESAEKHRNTLIKEYGVAPKEFLGNTYTLNQCESDLYEWFVQSCVGEYTHHYSNCVFHTKDGFFAAPGDNLSNYILI